MKRHRIKNLPIIDEVSKPLGVLTAQDVFQQLLSEVENEETLLRDYVMSVGYW
ncbi:signal-transduction protein [Hyphomicrobium denitrificans 1NES1]|uniref:Signal-transduction protein n=2 Tax=Hyphomicrobium denitrificans TaxID=53399 RepID=N0B6X3_9HYPH|nr:signal-transduction protein [Hyphomicrobium denitrificans 1NES1]